MHQFFLILLITLMLINQSVALVYFSDLNHPSSFFFFFFLNDTAPTEISPFPLPDALPICGGRAACMREARSPRVQAVVAGGIALVEALGLRREHPARGALCLIPAYVWKSLRRAKPPIP